MTNIFVDPSSAEDYESILVNGKCYKRVGSSQLTPDTLFIDEGFDSCEECLASPSPTSPSPSPSPSPSDTNACEGVDCSGDPSMQLRIFDADYSGSNIDWCGLTWTPAEIQAGVTKCACPTSYFLEKYLNTAPPPTGSSGTNRERWEWDDGFGGDFELFMERNYAFSLVFSSNYFVKIRHWQQIIISTSGTAGAPQNYRGIKQYKWGTPTTGVYGSTQTVTRDTMTMMNATTDNYLPTLNDYRLVDQQFGSYLNSNGVLFEYSRGIGW